jgi:hypothetical protein
VDTTVFPKDPEIQAEKYATAHSEKMAVALGISRDLMIE